MLITKEEAEKLAPWLTGLRRELHRHPELSFREFRTAALIERELDALGVSHRRVGETGVLATLRGELPSGRVVALRADIDALPVQEQRETEYRSETDGAMHACGHDGHTAALLGAVKLLSEHRDSWGGEVRFFFQAAEEFGSGARVFVEDGALEGVSRILGLHVAPDLPCGTLGIKAGLTNASVDGFRIEIKGRSSHVCAPEKGIDALYIGSQLVVALQAQVTRRICPVEPVIIGVGVFRAGTTYNAVAESAVLEGTVRAVTPETREQAKSFLEDTAAHISALYGGSAQVHWDDRGPALINDETAAAEVLAMVNRERPSLKTVTDRALSLSGDDFAEYLTRIPGVYVFLGTHDPARPETLNPIHSTSFEIDEAALPIGAWLYAETAADWLRDA